MGLVPKTFTHPTLKVFSFNKQTSELKQILTVLMGENQKNLWNFFFTKFHNFFADLELMSFASFLIGIQNINQSFVESNENILNKIYKKQKTKTKTKNKTNPPQKKRKQERKKETNK